MQELVYQGSPEEQAKVLATVERAAQSIAKRTGLGKQDAVVLAGGFGRGEGALRREPGAPGTPFNDFDLLIIGQKPAPPHAALDELRSSLPSILRVDFVDVGYIRSSDFRGAEPSVFLYELKHASRVLWGAPGVMETVPSIRASDLPVTEATRFFLNRGTGLLAVLLLMEARANRVLVQGCAATAWSKTVLAIGDSMLIQRKLYHWSYVERMKRIEEASVLPEGEGFLEKYRSAVAFKLTADFKVLPFSDPVELCREARFLHEHYFRLLEEKRTFSKIPDWREYPDAVLRVGLIPFSRRLKQLLVGLAKDSGILGELWRFARLPLYGDERRLALLPLVLYSVAGRASHSIERRYLDAAVAYELGRKGGGVNDWILLATRLAGNSHP